MTVHNLRRTCGIFITLQRILVLLFKRLLPMYVFNCFLILYYFFSFPPLYQLLFLFPFLLKIELGKTRLGPFAKNIRVIRISKANESPAFQGNSNQWLNKAYNSSMDSSGTEETDAMRRKKC